MTLELSHTIPHGSLPLTAMQEELSLAYIHMVASAAGLTVGSWSQDYDGRDATLSSSVDYSPNQYGPKIDIQLKSTGQQRVVGDDTVAWSLDTRTYDMISKTNRSIPSLFCVLVSPPEAGYWLHTSRDGLLARSHMYWVWGHQLPAVRLEQGHQVVHLPKANLLTPKSILELMEEASQWLPM